MSMISSRPLRPQELYKTQQLAKKESKALNRIHKLAQKQGTDETIVQLAEKLIQLEGRFYCHYNELQLGRISSTFKDDVLERIEEIKAHATGIIQENPHDEALSKDCIKSLTTMEKVKLAVLQTESSDQEEPSNIDAPPPDEEEDIDPTTLRQRIQNIKDLENVNLDIEKSREIALYRYIQKEQDSKLRLINVAGYGIGLVGLALAGAGTAVGAIGFGGLASGLGSFPAIGLIAAAGAAAGLGTGLAGLGFGGRIYLKNRLEPASQKYLSNYTEGETDSIPMQTSSTHAYAFSFEERQDMIKQWNKRHSVKLSKDDRIWLAAKGNFDHFLKLKHCAEHKQHRKDIKELIRLEREHVLWGGDCPCVDEG